MFDLTTYVKKWRIRQLKTVFSTLDTLCYQNVREPVCKVTKLRGEDYLSTCQRQIKLNEMQ